VISKIDSILSPIINLRPPNAPVQRRDFNPVRSNRLLAGQFSTNVFAIPPTPAGKLVEYLAELYRMMTRWPLFHKAQDTIDNRVLHNP
jgi:hypothetical protein